MRPFPQVDPGTMSREQLWHSYRDDILQRAGIAIFVFGNKLVSGEVVPSEGMREEFELALRNNVFPIPVGRTGSMAGELWRHLLELIAGGEFSVSDEVRGLIEQLGDDGKSLDQIRTLVLNLVSKI